MDYSSRIKDVAGLRFGVCHFPSLEVRSDGNVRGGGFCGMVLGDWSVLVSVGVLGFVNGKGDLDSFL